MNCIRVKLFQFSQLSINVFFFNIHLCCYFNSLKFVIVLQLLQPIACCLSLRNQLNILWRIKGLNNLYNANIFALMRPKENKNQKLVLKNSIFFYWKSPKYNIWCARLNPIASANVSSIITCNFECVAWKNRKYYLVWQILSKAGNLKSLKAIFYYFPERIRLTGCFSNEKIPLG